MSAGSEPASIWIRVCAWCGISLPEDVVTPEPARGSAVVTHGICPDCRDEFIRALTAERVTARSAGSPASDAH